MSVVSKIDRLFFINIRNAYNKLILFVKTEDAIVPVQKNYILIEEEYVMFIKFI